MQPALLGCTEPLGEGILKHCRLRVALPASCHCCKPSKDTGFKAEERVLQAAAAHPERLPAAEKRTEGLKTIPVSRVTLCHAKQPWGKPHPGRLRGGCAGPAGPPVLSPCSPSGAGRGARRLPKSRCPQPCSPARTVCAGWRLWWCRNSPCSLHPLQKTSLTGCLPPTQLIGAKGWGETLRHNPLCLVGWPRGP